MPQLILIKNFENLKRVFAKLVENAFSGFELKTFLQCFLIISDLSKNFLKFPQTNYTAVFVATLYNMLKKGEPFLNIFGTASCRFS